MEGSPVPVESVASVSNVWAPGARPVNVTGLAHGASGALSIEHCTVASVPAVKVNVAWASAKASVGLDWMGAVGCFGPRIWWSHTALFASSVGSATVHFSPWQEPLMT